jgi:spore coat polysaccharide biosynthesis protein SpsF
MIALARALRDREGIGALFAVNGSDDALAPIQRAGFETQSVDAAHNAEMLGRIVAQRAPDLLICDFREGLSREELQSLASHVSITAIVDDGSDRRLAGDVAYYPPVPQAEALDWTGAHCEARIGWQWALLGLGKPVARPARSANKPTLLVTMGGSDPAGLTLRSAIALSKLEPAFRARFVIGPGVAEGPTLAKKIAGLAPHFETIEDADGLATEYASCDMALATFGVTAYELGAYGVPAIYLCLTEDHALSASAFDTAGMGESLGLAAQVSDDDIAHAVSALMNDAVRRRTMRTIGLATIDGEGAVRVAADIAERLAVAASATAFRAAR